MPLNFILVINADNANLGRGARSQCHIWHLHDVCTHHRFLAVHGGVVHINIAFAITLDKNIANVIHFDFETIANGFFDDFRCRIAMRIIKAIQTNSAK